MSKFEIWGSIVDPKIDGQKVASHDDIQEAIRECDRLQNHPRNHPDLNFWICTPGSTEVVYPNDN